MKKTIILKCIRNPTLSINPAIMDAARPIRNTSGNSIITITNHLDLYTKRFQFITAKVIQNLFFVKVIIKRV